MQISLGRIILVSGEQNDSITPTPSLERLCKFAVSYINTFDGWWCIILHQIIFMLLCLSSQRYNFIVTEKRGKYSLQTLIHVFTSPRGTGKRTVTHFQCALSYRPWNKFVGASKGSASGRKLVSLVLPHWTSTVDSFFFMNNRTLKSYCKIIHKASKGSITPLIIVLTNLLS